MSESPAVILFDESGNPLGVLFDGTVYRLQVEAKNIPSTTSINSSVASSNSNVTLLEANSVRLGATIYNESTSDLYVKLGSNASTSDYTVKLSSGAYYESPFSYVGRIDGIWASVNGSARISELVG